MLMLIKKQSLLEINEINQKLETIVERLNQEYMINKIEEEINLKNEKRELKTIKEIIF